MVASSRQKLDVEGNDFNRLIGRKNGSSLGVAGLLLLKGARMIIEVPRSQKAPATVPATWAAILSELLAKRSVAESSIRMLNRYFFLTIGSRVVVFSILVEGPPQRFSRAALRPGRARWSPPPLPAF